MSFRSQADPYNLLGQAEMLPRHFRVDPFDLLGQKEPFPIAVYLPGTALPKLSIEWNSFHQNFFSGIPVFFSWTRLPKDAPPIDVFRDCRIQPSMPVRAVFAAALWHVIFFILPWPHFPVRGQRNPAFENTELTWSGPIDDLPLLNIPKPVQHKSAAPKPAAPDPPTPGVDAYHPRQRIFTDPVHPTHPRQTLVNTAAPPDPPKFLPPLPNMVQFAASSGPARPRLQISQATLAKLKPKAVKHTAATVTPAPDVTNMEMQPAEISLAQVTDAPAKPKLDINAGSTPRLAQQSQKGETVSAPELSTGVTGATGGPSSTIIALSTNPAPPAPVVEVPKGNLSARVSISPEGKGNGSGGGSGNGGSGTGGGSVPSGSSGAGNNSVGISISGGSPQPKSGMSGLGESKLIIPKPQAGYSRPEASVSAEETSERLGPPNFAALPPGAAPEQMFSSHRVYSLNVNMPNLNSYSGSWIIRFSELHLSAGGHRNDDVTTPVPLHKVDPKYPPDLLKEHVQGEVILYGVIREDGSVDSIQLVRGIDPQLNANSISAFSQWKFRPATKDGQPIALEAIVHIPFREPPRD